MSINLAKELSSGQHSNFESWANKLEAELKPEELQKYQQLNKKENDQHQHSCSIKSICCQRISQDKGHACQMQ